MKKQYYQLLANTCFWLGDKVDYLTRWLGCVFFWDLYQWLMKQSTVIQEKHNLSGPWKLVKDKGLNKP